jgi:hypothetical protein
VTFAQGHHSLHGDRLLVTTLRVVTPRDVVTGKLQGRQRLAPVSPLSPLLNEKE